MTLLRIIHAGGVGGHRLRLQRSDAFCAAMLLFRISAACLAACARHGGRLLSIAGAAKPLWPGARRRLAMVLCALPLCAAVSQSITIVQEHRAFAVSAISIALGETLHFSNQDSFTHQIYIETPQFTFESNEQEPGETVSVTFPAHGHFAVHCHIHPKMQLDVDVQ